MGKELVPSHLLAPAGTGSLDSYIQEVNRIPVLTLEEEQDLARRYRDQEDLDAARLMVMSHLRFVVHVARGYSGYGLQISDLIQEGNIGLMKAVKRFDPDVGVRLISFAVHWIRAEIHEYVIRNWRMVKVASTKAQRKLFFKLRSAKNRLGWFTRDEVEAVAEDLGVKPETVVEMEGRLAGQDTSFDAPVDAGEDDLFSPSAWMEAPDGDPAEWVERADTTAHEHEGLAQALATLDDRSRDILQARWLGESKQTLQDLANRYGVSAERIRQLENNAIRRLRKEMAAAEAA